MQMKYKILAGLIASCVATGAFAQTSVTLYGVIDLSLNYTTHQNAAGDHVFSLGDSGASTGAGDAGQGALSGSRWGLKGEEDLGGGTKAIFKLESGFTANNGQSDQQGQLFGRQEYVGLSNSSAGTITFGRQYGTMTDVAFDYDPLGVGNYLANEWEVFLFGVRFDNTIKYSNQFGPVQVNVQYSVGGQAGSDSNGTTLGTSVKYDNAGLGLAAGFQQSQDKGGNDLTVWTADVKYTFGPATVFGNYYHISTDPGFGKAPSLSGGPLANTSIFINNGGNTTTRKDQLWVAGFAYNLTPATTLTLGYMDDQISQDIVGDGSMKTAYALLEYRLSKRTEVYLTADESKATGQAATSAASGSGTFNGVGAGQSNASAVAAGLRVTF
jgi:predicted porin